MPWLKRTCAKHKLPAVWEIGSGDGDLLREMRAAGIVCLGFEPAYLWNGQHIPVDLINCILPREAQDAGPIKETPAIILACRPCHSGFPGQVNAVAHPLSPMFYVGFRKNLAFDLGGAFTSLVFKSPVGLEGEQLFQVRRPLEL